MAAMENSSLPSDVLNNVTTSLSEGNDSTLVRDLAFKVLYIVTGIVGVLDNLFVIVIFIFFIKIADKVLSTKIVRWYLNLQLRTLNEIRRINVYNSGNAKVIIEFSSSPS